MAHFWRRLDDEHPTASLESSKASQLPSKSAQMLDQDMPAKAETDHPVNLDFQMDSTEPFVAQSARIFPVLRLKALGAVLGLLALAIAPIHANAETVEIIVKDIAFAPTDVQAKVGDTIRWRNRDPVPHTATAE